MGRDERSTPGGERGSLSAIEEQILRAVTRIRYGSVEVTIHDSRIVQIEQKEKVRVGHEESRQER